jgi:hypothetical protein
MSNAELIAKVTEAGGRVFVGFKNPDAAQGVDERGRVLAASNAVSLGKASLRSMGAQVELEFKKTPVVVASMSPAMVAALRRSPYVEYVEPIFPGEYLSQDTTWNVKRVNAPAAWINNSDGSGAILLMLDSGIPASHTDLSPTFTGACDGSNGIDTFGHGSAVAGIIAASDNSTQIIGVSPGVSLWSIRIGAMGPDPAAAACGVDTGRDFGVDVITLSFTLSSTYTALTDEINGAYYQDDIVVVAAAGNDNGGAVTYPATLAAAIAVSATDSANSIASFSSVGSKVEIAAPGTTVDGSTGLTSTCLSGSTCGTVSGQRMEGTSFAAPHVAAAAAILATSNYSWSAAEIRRRLGAGATDLGTSGRDNYYGFGLLNITASIAAPHIVSISGPTMVPENYTADFEAIPVGGNAPYTFTWRVDGVVQQQSSSSSFSWSASSSYTLSVSAVDAIPNTANASTGVTVCPGWVFSC